MRIDYRILYALLGQRERNMHPPQPVVRVEQDVNEQRTKDLPGTSPLTVSFQQGLRSLVYLGVS
jgi:hypothetical protein